MKYLIILIVSISFLGCSNNEQIAEFEKVLGYENSETLTLMVFDFENGFLKNKYPNLTPERAYKKLLIEMRDNKDFSWGKLPKFNKTRFEKSRLKYEIYSYVDSVWTETGENPKMVLQYKVLNGDGNFITRVTELSHNPQVDKVNDSIIKNYYTWTDLNYEGRYWKALKKVHKSNQFISNYLEVAVTGGPVQPELLIDELLNSNPNYSDYFIKRIIVTNISY
ncbi:MAG: hypothetical protein COA88_13580 [Kordia sp.]|nr:MAG: hypothetical protein COA88_13580 [Kordia sp.]